MRALAGKVLRRRRGVCLCLGLTAVLVALGSPPAHADIWANVGPGSSLSGLKGGPALGNYELDEHFTAVSAGVFSGVDVSGLLPMIAFAFGNWLWLGTSWLANIVIELFGFAFSLDLVNGSAATNGAGALGPVSRAIQTIYGTAFGGPWMVLAVSVAALWAMWKALVQRRYAETASQLAMSLIYVCLAFLFVLEPGQTIGTASHWTNQMSGAFLSIAKDGEPQSQGEAKEAGADQLFGLLVAQPWAVLEFGGLDHCVKAGGSDEPESVAVAPIEHSAARRLESGETVTSGGKTCINNLKRYGPHFLRMAAGSKEREEEEEALAAGDSSKLPDSDPGKKSGSYELGPADTPAAASMEKGGQYQRLPVALVIFVAELGAFFLLGALSIGIIVAQVLLLLLLAFSPVALVAAAVPGRGHQFFKAWLAKLAGYLLRKATYSLILAILLAVCAAISAATSELGWLFSFGLQCAFFWAVFLQRKTLTDGLVGAVAGPDAPGRDRALSLLALYAGARTGSRVLVRPVERVGRGARRGIGRAGDTFLGRGRDQGAGDVAPSRATGAPSGGVRKSVDFGDFTRSRDGHDEGRGHRRRSRAERRRGDDERDRRRSRTERGIGTGLRRGGSGGDKESAGLPEEEPPRQRRGRGGWRRSSGRRRGRAVSSPQTAAAKEARGLDPSQAANGGPNPRPRAKVERAPTAPPSAPAPRPKKGVDLADELRGDVLRKSDAPRRPAPESTPAKEPRPDARDGSRERKGRGR
jgi:hypothetical protein